MDEQKERLQQLLKAEAVLIRKQNKRTQEFHDMDRRTFLGVIASSSTLVALGTEAGTVHAAPQCRPFINGVKVATVTDSTYTHGQFALLASKWVNAQFDNISVVAV